MSVQRHAAEIDRTAVDSEFELDLSIVESGRVVTDLLRSTSDNCGQTDESACVTCFN
ncbi:MAG: FxLD family lanthipeptide [Pseudonocardiaceae bacterium]